MTNDFPLPPELKKIEQELAARPHQGPSKQLKARCLGGLQSELRRQEVRSRWMFAVAVAATVLVGLNLAISAGQATDFGLRPDGRQQSIQKTAAEIRRLLPEVPPREAARQAMLLHSGASIVPCPKVAAGRVMFDKNLEVAKSDR
jgi:hypothetical protein